MQENEIKELLSKQKDFFYSGRTLSVPYRLAALKKLKAAIVRYENQITAALQQDLGKSNFESFMCEIGLVKSELSYMIQHTARFSGIKVAKTPISQFAAKSFVMPSPYGNVLIMSPWNYPFLLTLDPLIDALAAGNTAIIKPSIYSPATSSLIEKIITDCFPSKYVAVVTGGRSENQCLLQQKFNYIFFTGSQAVGKEVMRHAANHLTPVTLELGGKSPCIIDETANLALTAKRIVFGKFLNCGQTCVAPDYIICSKKIENSLISELRKQIVLQYGTAPLQNKDYGKIINEKHFLRLSKLMNTAKTVYGGKANPNTMQIEPTILANVNWNDAVMKEEIFGPILPVLTYDSLSEVIQSINTHGHPLALYIFSNKKTTIQKLLNRCSFGGGCINDTIIHLATPYIGFGGEGASGMGAYHGKTGFQTFSHYKSIVDKKTFMDLPMRYQPYNRFHEKLLHLFLH